VVSAMAISVLAMKFTNKFTVAAMFFLTQKF